MADKELEKAILNDHLVFGLIDLGPIFFINGRVYYCLESSDPDTKDFKIREGPRLEVLEKISDDILKSSYKEFKKGFLERIVKNIYDSDSGSSNKLINFAINQIFPHLRKDSQALESLLEISDESQEKIEASQSNITIEEYIKEDKKNSTIYRLNECEGISTSPKFNSKILDMMNDYNFTIFNENVFLLKEMERGERERGSVSIGDKTYSLVKSISLKEFKKHFTENITSSLVEEAVEEEKRNGFASSKLKEKISNFNLINAAGHYDEEDFGFIKNDRGLYVYVIVPDYILKSTYGEDCFRFDSHKIGIDICFRGDSPCILRFPYTHENVEGPFYRLGEHDLCMGYYDHSFIDHSPDKGESFAKLLVDARNVTLRGYGDYGGTPHRPLDKRNFSHRLISYGEAKKFGISNINVQGKKWKTN